MVFLLLPPQINMVIFSLRAAWRHADYDNVSAASADTVMTKFQGPVSAAAVKPSHRGCPVTCQWPVMSGFIINDTHWTSQNGSTASFITIYIYFNACVFVGDPKKKDIQLYFDPSHWDENVVILMKSSSLAELKVVILTTFGAASEEDFIKMTTFSFQCLHFSSRYIMR